MPPSDARAFRTGVTISRCPVPVPPMALLAIRLTAPASTTVSFAPSSRMEPLVVSKLAMLNSAPGVAGTEGTPDRLVRSTRPSRISRSPLREKLRPVVSNSVLIV